MATSSSPSRRLFSTRGRRCRAGGVLVIDDGPTLTHGDMPFGAGLVAARSAGAAGSSTRGRSRSDRSRTTFDAWPQLQNVLPAMGYSDEQLHDLEQTINAVDCDVVVTGTPIDLARLVRSVHPIRHVRYELREVGEPNLEQVLAPLIAKASARRPALVGEEA